MPFPVLDACFYLFAAEKLLPEEVEEALAAMFPEVHARAARGPGSRSSRGSSCSRSTSGCRRRISLHIGNLDLDRERALQLPVVQNREWATIQSETLNLAGPSRCLLPQSLPDPHPGQGRGANAFLTSERDELLPIAPLETQRQPLGQLWADFDLHRSPLLGEVGEIMRVPELRFLFDVGKGWDAAMRFCWVAQVNRWFRSAHEIESLSPPCTLGAPCGLQGGR